MLSNLSIGIVTYLGRFERYLIPLIHKLHRIFPEYQKIIFINGHYDLEKQVHYLKKITTFLNNYQNISYLTLFQHQPLARGWNWLILMSGRERILILNDDVNINYAFRHNLSKIKSMPDMFLINCSYGHFVISKKIIREVGWFDERFLGLGCEDIDYTFRMARKGIATKSLSLFGISDQSAPQTDAGWANISAVDQGIRNSQINRDFLEKKWFCSEFGQVPEERAFKALLPIAGREWLVASKDEIEETPNYYPLECLDTPIKYCPNIRHLLLSLISRVLGFVQCSLWEMRIAFRLRTRLRQLFD